MKCRDLTPFWGRAEVERALAVCNGVVLWGNCFTAHITLCPADLNTLLGHYGAVRSATTNTLHIVVFWVMKPCILVGEYRRFGGDVRLYLQAVYSFETGTPAYQDWYQLSPAEVNTTLMKWWSLRGEMIPRTLSAVACLLVGSPLTDRSTVMT